jgi:spoIIIJ-associated protein
VKLRGEEFSGRTVEEAIERGLVNLGKKRSDVDIEVLEEGKPANMLGLGGEDARVLITFQAPDEPEEEPVIDEEEVPRRPDAVAVAEDGDLDEAPPAYAEELVAGAAALRELLEKMGVQAEVSVHDRPEPVLEVLGPDLGALIGRHGENLVALQQITSLITSRRVGRSVHVAVDVEGYRRRREAQLREIARRVAGRVRATNQAVTLEPMMAYERRIVHLALHEDRDVKTESVGMDPNRRVVVLPKRASLAASAGRPMRPFRPARPGGRPSFGRRPPGTRPPYRRPFGPSRP